MKIKFSVDTNDIDDDFSFEDLFSHALRQEITDKVKNDVLSDQFKKFSQLTSDTIVADVKLRMENFLSEEISLTAGYGEKTFVGSIEDLIKKRFDDVLLRPVDGSGKNLKGCTSSGQTWIEWRIENELEKRLNEIIQRTKDSMLKDIGTIVGQELQKIVDSGIRQKVSKALTSLINNE